MITLIIIGAIIFILLILLFLPISLDFSYDHDFVLKIKYSGITLFDNRKKSDKEQREKKKEKRKISDEAPTKKDNFIKRTYKKKGLAGTIGYFGDIVSIAFQKIRRLAKRIKFRNFSLDVVVATDDAANTAIQYGRVCSAVYPVLSLLEALTDFKSKKINISTDFDNTKSAFKISGLVKTKLIYLLIAATGFLTEFLKLERKEREKYERKQHKNSNGHHNGKTSHNG